MNRNKALFLDRDGTLIEDVGYIGDPDLVRLLPGVGSALLEFRRAGYLLIAISNQSGIGRGFISEEQYRQVHARILADLAQDGVTLAEAYYCPHHPNAQCHCRKPNPHFLLQAAEMFNLDLHRSWMVGDKLSDVEAGAAVSCTTVLLQSSVPTDAVVKPDHVCADWSAIQALLLTTQYH
jgi:D-glycero-D-manno-heptose 1,7-bisphosphate phosphatase